MAQESRSAQLLRRVAWRMRVASLVWRFCLGLLVLAAGLAAALLTSRLSGLFPLELSGMIVGGLIGAAAVVALLWHHRPTPSEAARRIDRAAGTKDLFLTTALLDGAAGEFRPLVARDAEARAGTIDPAAIVPLRIGRRSRAALVGACELLVLVSGQLWVPQLDPFGQVAAAEQTQAERKELTDSRRATAHRAAQLRRDDEGQEGENSERVEKALQELKTVLKKMKPQHKAENAQALAGQQKQLGSQWQQLNAEGLKNLMKQVADGQQFGGASKEKLEKWARELQEGSTESLQKELDELKDELERLAATKDPVKRAELAQQLKKRMRDLEEFASEKANSKPLAAALERAMKQLELGTKLDEMSEDALEAARESLNLSKLELKEIAQSARDLKKLEEALRVVQMAKKLNDEDKLDGEAGQNFMTMEDYAELYAELMQGQMQMEGETGVGGDPEAEDDSVETGFKAEQSKSPVVAGKVLLSMKTKGLSDRGDAVKAYRDNLATIKQGVSEAINQEQIPPGYHEGIKSYFDTLAPPAATK